jgi:DNA-binding NarL/FixJ family response regulator
MSTVLEISILPKESLQEESLLFFSSEHWDHETELQLVQRIHELIYILRPFGVKLELSLHAEVTDASTVKFLIKKKLDNQCQINTQKLTSREVEIIGLIMQGFTNHEIAEKLFISFETVRSHRKHILNKTGAKNTAALINYYHQTFFEK